MDAWWYYSEDGETVGPTSVEEIANWIRQAKSQSHFVWTEGMPEWTEAGTVPEFSTEFQAASPALAPNAKFGAETKRASAAKQATLAQRARNELIEYLGISTYLYVCFGALIFYKATILRSEGIEFTPFGLAIVKALILGKFILMLQALKIGEGGRRGRIVLVSTIKKSFVFMLLLFILTIIEELIVGHFHGRASREVLSEIAGGTLPQAFAIGVLLFLILIPYFAFREIATSLGEGELSKLFTERRSPENQE
jgi:hypothetical protein